MKLTISSSTGHFAMFHTLTALSPTPITFPTCLARPPVRTTATATTASRTRSTTVVPIRVGSVFQIGRPSSTS